MLQDFHVKRQDAKAFFLGSTFIHADTDSAGSYPKAECWTWHNCTFTTILVFLSPLYRPTLTFYSLVGCTLTLYSLVGCDLCYRAMSELHMSTQRLVLQHCKKFLPQHIGRSFTTSEITNHIIYTFSSIVVIAKLLHKLPTSIYIFANTKKYHFSISTGIDILHWYY